MKCPLLTLKQTYPESQLLNRSDVKNWRLSAPSSDRLEESANHTIAACSGDARDAVKALIVANGYSESEVRELRAADSPGYARGKFELVLRDRNDWYD